jgi:hypothetical protein
MKRLSYQGMLKEGLKPTAALRAAQVSMWKDKKPGGVEFNDHPGIQG